METTEVAKICQAFSDANRLTIVQMLTKSELCGCELLEQLNITQPTLSHHMKILAECNLINTRKEGRWSHYSLNCETLKAYREFIGKLICKPSGKARSCDCK